MAKNKNLIHVAEYEYDEDLDKWVPKSQDETVEGQLLVTTYNRPDFYTGTVTITSAGTAQQGPSIQVPPGFAVAVKGRDGNTGNIFFARSQTDAQTAANRVTLAPGSGARIFITNVNLMWFDAATSNDIVEILVER